jgi:hypothetical protein
VSSKKENTLRPGELIHQWYESKAIGRAGEDLAYNLLEHLRLPNSWFRTLAILDLSAEVEFQKLGIDFAWFVKAATCCCSVTVEVKADQNSHTGNFFFETTSDVERNTPGAFLCSTAEWYFYTFPNTDRIYCLPLYDAREWFFANRAHLQERTVRSERSGRSWQTIGTLVPIRRFVEEVRNVKHFELSPSGWIEIQT